MRGRNKIFSLRSSPPVNREEWPWKIFTIILRENFLISNMPNQVRFFYLRVLPLILFNFHFRYLFRWIISVNFYGDRKWISNQNIYYFGNFLGWKNSVRHNLSLHPIFVREQPSANSKVSYWCMRPQNNELPLIDDYDEYGRKPEKKRKRERKGTDLNS